MNGGVWTPASRNEYNLRDAVSRCTTQVRCLLKEILLHNANHLKCCRK